jgi:hypothetical protein
MPSFIPFREIPEGLRSALNLSGATILAQRGVTGNENAITIPAATTDTWYGLVRGDIPDQALGNVQQGGKGIGTAGAAGVTAGSKITIEAATGKFVNAAPGAGVNTMLCGVAEQTAAADATFEFTIAKPGSTLQG